MAEKQIDATGGVAANRPTGPEVEILDSTDALVRSAPAPADKGGKIYAVAYPTDRFLVEGMPVVDAVGTRLTDAQAKEILPIAEASGVRIVEVN